MAVVRLLDGEVVLDSLAVKLTRPGAAVAVGGGRRVTLKNCTVTLDDPGAAAVRLLAGGGEAAVALADTLVRGRGLGVVVGDRPAEVTVTNSWAALAGPLVRSDGDVRLTLTRVTAAVAGPLFDPRGGGLTVTADRCLFAPVGGRLQLAPAGEAERVEWTAGGPCWFADPGFSVGSVGPLATAVAVTFQTPPVADELAAVERADFAVTTPDPPAGGVGADAGR